MVVGNGLMASAFSNYRDNKEILIFASGVSNSTETDAKAFTREYNLLKETITGYPDFKLVYFSTLSIEDTSVQERPYITHKILLENYIRENAKKYLIARISNVVGPSGNSHTIINYLVNAIRNEDTIEIWELAERNIIGNEDIKFIIVNLLKTKTENSIVNIASSKSLLVTDIVVQIELYLQKKANAVFLKKGSSLNIDVSEIANILAMLDKKHGNGLAYLNHLLKKYY